MKNLEAHFKEIKKQYPKTMSKDQLYRVAHISKATALYLLQSGAIPCKDTGKKTRRYTIKTDDVIEYLRQREICPEKYKASEGWYAGTAGAKKAIAPSCWITLTPEQTKQFELFFEAEMKEMADLITVAEDRTKNKSSMRTLPLVPFVKERLLELKAEQEENRRLCGRSYVKDYTGYVCINEIGDIIKPNYVSCGFPKLLEEHGLRRVRYHDLRHSCASLLLANGVPMKQIQEWLGHSDFSTTANIYAHLEYSSKVISADAMLAGLGIGNRE